MTLTEFLLARITEDEASLPTGFDCWYDPDRYVRENEAKRRIIEEHAHGPQTYTSGCTDDFGCWTCHIGANGEDYNGGWCLTLRALAMPYADHPDYDTNWTT